jgi:hypothetical protein
LRTHFGDLWFIPVFAVMYIFTIFLVILQIRKLDDTEFRNAFSRAYIRVWVYFFSINNLIVFKIVFACLFDFKLEYFPSCGTRDKLSETNKT